MKPYLIFSVLLLLALSLSCRAVTPEEAIADYYNTLPPAVADAIPSEVAKQLEEGDATATARLDATYLFDFLGATLTGTLRESLPSLMTLLGTVLLAALLRALSLTVGDTAGKALRFATGLSLILALLRVVKPAWQQATDTITGMGLLSKSVLPLITLLGTASGSVSSSTVHATWLTALLTLLEQLGETILPTLFGIAFGFLLLSLFLRLTESGDLSGLVGSIKTIFTVLLTGIGTALSAVMTFQGVLAKSSDTVLLRSIKFASGHLIPVVGSTLSETAGSYLASLGLVRSAAGTLVALSLLLFVIPPIGNLLVCRLGFLLASTVAGILGCSQEGDTIREAAALLDLALATVAILSGIFLLLAGVFASTMAG